MFHSGLRLSLVGVCLSLAVLGCFGALASTTEEAAVDSFRRLVFMVNLDPPPWDQVTAEADAISAWAQTQSGGPVSEFGMS